MTQYGDAYVLHPRNPEAAQALGRALEAFGGQLEGASTEVRAEARAGLESMRERHPALAQYAPLTELIEELSS